MTHWLALIPSPNLSPLVESAFRGLLLAVLVAALLAVLRVRNVVAQKSAWLCVLVCAFAMPALAPLALRIPIPEADAVNFYLHRTQRITATTRVTPITPQITEFRTDQHIGPLSDDDDSPVAPVGSGNDRFSGGPSNPTAAAPDVLPASPPISRLQFLFLLYAAVCATLLFRLVRGAAIAFRLWHVSVPVEASVVAPFAANIPVRSSAQIASPINIASGILLPADYPTWDREKLSIVLAHEASHVRQRDFYLQLVANLYAAIFWFSPLGWWMQRRLSDLSEAISDRAALQQAASPASYAQILLQFAAQPRLAPTGVAMARPGRLTQRIERLLDESRFRDAFSVTRIRTAATLLLIPAALFASTALVRVQAAQTQPAPVPPPPAAEPQSLPAAPSSLPPSNLAPAPQVKPVPSKAPASPPAEPPIVVAVPATPPIELISKAPPVPPTAILLKDEAPAAPILAVPQAPPPVPAPRHQGNYGSWTSTGRNGDFYGYFMRYGGSPHFTGSHQDVIAKVEALTKGDFLLYIDTQGKSYYIDDPHTLSQMEAVSAATRNLNLQKLAMERAQKAMQGAQIRIEQEREKAVETTPDLQKDLANLNAAIAKLQAQNQKSITPEELADLQRKLGEMQGTLVRMQLGDQLATMHIDTTELTRKLARLKIEEANNDWNSDLSRNGSEMMKALIDEAMKNGKAKPVQ